MTTTRLIRFILYALFFILLIAGGWYFIKGRFDGEAVGYAAPVFVNKLERHCQPDDTPIGKIPEGKLVIDEAFFQTIRDRYNGQLGSIATDEENEDVSEGSTLLIISDTSGEMSGEILKNGNVLIDFSGQLAEMAFYLMAKVPEDIQYIPALTTCNTQGTESTYVNWLNYFARRGDSMYCGFYSSDLKKDPDKQFKCRFMIGSQGKPYGFLDRSARNSNANPGSFEGWEDGLRDFYWRSPQTLQSPAVLHAYSDKDITYSLRIEAPLANAIYDALPGKEQEKYYYWGRKLLVMQKESTYVLCEKIELEAPVCKIKFEKLTGRVLDYQQEK